jgi:hypothetical protein
MHACSACIGAPLTCRRLHADGVAALRGQLTRASMRSQHATRDRFTTWLPAHCAAPAAGGRVRSTTRYMLTSWQRNRNNC